MSSFKDIIGQKRILDALQNAIATNKVSHAYIFSGASGSGKNLIADSFAKALQCENASVDACGVCTSCRVFENRNHPDVIYVSPKGKSLGVDEIRQSVVKQMDTAPYKYRYKVFIIDRAHIMTDQAQNALLKTIEEPAGYGIFLMLAEGLDFLPTVLSRCICYKLAPLAYHEVCSFLKASGIDENIAQLASIYSHGNIGRGLSLSNDDEFIEMRKKVMETVKRLPSAELAEVFAMAKSFDEFKERIQDALDIMFLWYRDMLALRITDMRFVIQQNEVIASGSEAVTGVAAVTEAKHRLRYYANFQLTIEIMLLDIWEAIRKTPGTQRAAERSNTW